MREGEECHVTGQQLRMRQAVKQKLHPHDPKELQPRSMASYRDQQKVPLWADLSVAQSDIRISGNIEDMGSATLNEAMLAISLGTLVSGERFVARKDFAIREDQMCKRMSRKSREWTD